MIKGNSNFEKFSNNNNKDEDDDEDDKNKNNKEKNLINRKILNGYHSNNDDRKRVKRDLNDNGHQQHQQQHQQQQQQNDKIINFNKNNFKFDKSIKIYLETIKDYRFEIDEGFKRLQETKEYVDKIFEFYEEDIEIRILSLQTEIEKHQQIMFSKMDKLMKKIKGKPFTVKKLRKFENNIRKLERKIIKFKNDDQMLNKISFQINYEMLDNKNVGQLNNPLNCKYNKIKTSNSITIPFELLVCLTYFDEMKRIIITDFNDRSFKVLDLNGNYLGSYNPDSILERPGPVCASNITKEIYIQDHVYEKIFVFDLNFNYLRDFGDERCQTPFGSSIDETENKIYLSAYLSNIVTIWDTQTGDFVHDIEIYSPTFMNIFRNKLIIMSATESEIFKMHNTLQSPTNNQNSIYIYNKTNYQILNKIKITNCIHPKGLFIDENMNIYLTAYDDLEFSEELTNYNNNNNNVTTTTTTTTERTTDDNNRLTLQDSVTNGDIYQAQSSSTIHEKTRYLYKLAENGDLLQKTNLSLSGIFSMVIVEKKLYAIRGYRAPPIYMIEFE